MVHMKRILQKQPALAAGLGAVILAIVRPSFMPLSVRPYELPLRIGMTENDVESAPREPVPLTFEWVMEHEHPVPRTRLIGLRINE